MDVYTDMIDTYSHEVEVIDELIKQKQQELKKYRNSAKSRRLADEIYSLKGMRNDCILAEKLLRRKGVQK